MATILVIDDDPVVCRLASHILELAGYSVVTLNNGREALHALEASTPDLVITDIMMPDMNGIELLQHIRADRRWADLPVIVLTARGSMDDRRKVAEAGTIYFLTKPFSSAQLVDQVKRLCPP